MVARGSGTEGEVGKTGVRRVQRELCGFEAPRLWLRARMGRVKLWRLAEPFDDRFARAGRVGGTWQEGEYQERRRPLLIEWEPGSDVVGDFTWPGTDTDIVVSDRVGVALRDAGVQGFELKPVEMQEQSDAAKRRSRMPRVQVPYSGVTLWDLWVGSWVRADRKRSTIEERQRPDGAIELELTGVQRRESTWNQTTAQLARIAINRSPGQGLFVSQAREVFRVMEFPGWVLCTDDVKRLVETNAFTNVAFFEMGEEGS